MSRRENLIAIEVDLDQLHQTAEKIDTSEQTVMHLTKRNNGSVLSFGFRRKLNDNMVDVFRDVAIRILQGDEADGVTAPSVRKPHWQLEVPRPKMFQAAIERCAHLGISEVGLNFILPDPANHDIGELKLKGSSGELDIEVNFIDCPRFAESEEDVSPDGIAQFQTKMLQQVVTTGCAISEKMVLCPSFGSTMVIYCVLHGVCSLILMLYNRLMTALYSFLFQNIPIDKYLSSNLIKFFIIYGRTI